MTEKKEIELVKYEMSIPKESKELIDLINAVLEKIMAGEPLSTYMELMDEVYLAADGVSMIGAEVKSQYSDEMAGYLTHKIMGTLMIDILPSLNR